MLGSDITDQLLNQHRFSYAGASEQSDLTTLLIRAEQVNDFNSRFQKFRFRRLLLKCRSRPVDRLISNSFRSRFVVYRLS